MPSEFWHVSVVDGRHLLYNICVCIMQRPVSVGFLSYTRSSDALGFRHVCSVLPTAMRPWTSRWTIGPRYVSWRFGPRDGFVGTSPDMLTHSGLRAVRCAPLDSPRTLPHPQPSPTCSHDLRRFGLFPCGAVGGRAAPLRVLGQTSVAEVPSDPPPNPAQSMRHTFPSTPLGVRRVLAPAGNPRHWRGGPAWAMA